MLDEIYSWLESYAGVSYDFDESIKELSQLNACVDPFEWKISIEDILDNLDDANDVIDQFKTAIPVNLPSATKIKRTLAENMLSGIVKSIRGTCDQLNIDIDAIQTIDQLRNIVQTMYELLTMLNTNDITTIIQKGLYESHEEGDDDSFAEVLGVMKEDMSSLAMNFNAIRDAYYDTLDAESVDDVE